MRYGTILVLVSCFLAAACGRTNSADSEDQESGPGTGEFSVTSDQPTAGSTVGASFSVTTSFTTQRGCSTMTVGACTVNPCYGSTLSGTESAPLPTAGEVTFTGTASSPLVVTPQSDGNYATESVVGAVPWNNGGDSLTFAWASFPGNAGQAGDILAISAPPYIALTTGSAFASSTSSLLRTQDLMIGWTSDTAPTDLDEVSFDVITGSVQVYCIFNAGAGEGVVPSAALGYLQTGDGTYSIVSKEHVYESINDGDGAWGMNFNVNALARTSYGLARGPLTVQ